MQHVRGEAVTLCLAGGLIEAEVHPRGAGTYGVLLVAQAILLPEIGFPFFAAMTTGNACVEVEVEELAVRAGSAGILTVAALVGCPVEPIIESRAVRLRFAHSNARLREDQPISKMARPSGIRFKTVAVSCCNIARQTFALSLERVQVAKVTVDAVVAGGLVAGPSSV